MNSRRHQIVARAFRRRRCQDRRLEFEKAAVFHAFADRVDDRAAQHDVVVQLLAAQIEKAIFEPDLFRVFLVAEHRHRQVTGRAQDFDLVDINLDLARRQVRVLGAFRPLAQLAVDPDHPFRPQRLSQLEGRTVGITDHLGQAVMVAQVDEQHAAMVANPVAPARQTDILADVAFAQRAAGVGTIAMHGHSRGNS